MTAPSRQPGQRPSRVLVSSVGGNVGQGIIKSLRCASSSFYIYGVDIEPLSAGFAMVDGYACVPRTGTPEYRSALLRIIEREGIEAVYVCSPAELPWYAANREALKDLTGVTVFVNPPSVVDIGSDKLLTADFLRDHGFPYAEAVLADDAQGLNALIARWGFPLIAKPRAGFSSRNVFEVGSLEEIHAAARLVPDLIVQRYLPDDEGECTAGTMSGADGRVRACVVLRRDLIQGTTYRTELVEEPTLIAQVCDITNALGAVGPCNLQFRTVDGNAIVFEINPRFSGTSGVRYLYGFNDAQMAFDLLHRGEELRQPPLRHAVVLRYWNEVIVPGASFESVRRGGQPMRGHIVDMAVPDSTFGCAMTKP